MKSVAYLVLWLSMLLVLVIAFSPRAGHAQSAGKTDLPATRGDMQGQQGMEGMRGDQGDGRQMTCV